MAYYFFFLKATFNIKFYIFQEWLNKTTSNYTSHKLSYSKKDTSKKHSMEKHLIRAVAHDRLKIACLIFWLNHVSSSGVRLNMFLVLNDECAPILDWTHVVEPQFGEGVYVVFIPHYDDYFISLDILQRFQTRRHFLPFNSVGQVFKFNVNQILC